MVDTSIFTGPIAVFDVESIGLYGEGYAVGMQTFRFTPPNGDWELIDEFLAYCNPDAAMGARDGRDWVEENAHPRDWRAWCERQNNPVTALPLFEGGPRGVRNAFWKRWEGELGRPTLFADVPYPVESNFLRACIADNPERKGPYPLLDTASALFANGVSPMEYGIRLPQELPAHNPLADARQSARQLRGAVSDRIAELYLRG